MSVTAHGALVKKRDMNVCLLPLADASDAVLAGGVGIVGLILASLSIVLAILWLIFPFIVMSSLGKIRNELGKTRNEIENTNNLLQQQLRGLNSLRDTLAAAAAENAAASAAQSKATNTQLQQIFDAHARTNQLLDWAADLAAKKTGTA